jgi:hypothetical protein
MRPLVGLASSWLQVLAIRFRGRVGKGIRTSPRDALLADLVPARRAGPGVRAAACDGQRGRSRGPAARRGAPEVRLRRRAPGLPARGDPGALASRAARVEGQGIAARETPAGFAASARPSPPLNALSQGGAIRRERGAASSGRRVAKAPLSRSSFQGASRRPSRSSSCSRSPARPTRSCCCARATSACRSGRSRCCGRSSTASRRRRVCRRHPRRPARASPRDPRGLDRLRAGVRGLRARLETGPLWGLFRVLLALLRSDGGRGARAGRGSRAGRAARPRLRRLPRERRARRLSPRPSCSASSGTRSGRPPRSSPARRSPSSPRERSSSSPLAAAPRPVRPDRPRRAAMIRACRSPIASTPS